MRTKNPAIDQVHFLPNHYTKQFGCGIPVAELVDREEDWGAFNRLRSTTWREVNCTGCLERLYQKKKAEAAAIGEKLGKEWI